MVAGGTFTLSSSDWGSELKENKLGEKNNLNPHRKSWIYP
jgi:hypothetical protein